VITLDASARAPELTILSSQAPPAEAAAFFKQVPTARKWGSSGYYMYRCNRSWSASFSFDGSDKQFTVSSEYSKCSTFRPSSEGER